MLDEAAALCVAQGEHPVLVVDGLDEDRGVTANPTATASQGYSPLRLPPGLTVVVAGRLNPPITGDHPLRDPPTTRPLTVSPSATTIRREMECELSSCSGTSPIWWASRQPQSRTGCASAAGPGWIPRPGSMN
jgi:hypothetical protein